MRKTSKQYANALYNSVCRDEALPRLSIVIQAFVEILIADNMINQADKIIKEFIKIWNKEKGIVEANIKSTRELDEAQIKSLNIYIKKLAKARIVEIKTAEDKSLLGGIVIRYGDKVLDASLKNRLINLRQEIKK